jgi:NAD(P)-dependent dehydrogenase (short-subunit alcohol dehydrogenase family)
MGDRLHNKVAVVTGGASGIGKASALRFIAEGANVVVADYNAENGKTLLDEVAAGGNADQLRFVRADVAQEADVEAMIATAVDEFGRIDVLFNNAGVGGAFGPITDITVDDWDYTFAVLVRGVFLGMKHGVRAMKQHGDGGAIVNTASVAGLSGGAGPLAYSAAKAAVINLTRAAAVDLGPLRIRVNAICPGGILTPLISLGGNEEAMAPQLDKLQPWPAHGEAGHIAGAALYLASADAEFVTGQALIVDGGLTAAGPRLFQNMGVDLNAFPVAGVSRGTTGEPPEFRMTDEATATD